MAKKRSRIDNTPWYMKENTPKEPEVWIDVDHGFGKAPGDHKSSDDKREIKLKEDYSEPKSPLAIKQDAAVEDMRRRQGISTSTSTSTSTPKEGGAFPEVFDQSSTPTAATQAADTTTPSSSTAELGDDHRHVWVYERGDGERNDELMKMGEPHILGNPDLRMFTESEMRDLHKMILKYSNPTDPGFDMKAFFMNGTKLPDTDGWTREIKLKDKDGQPPNIGHVFTYYDLGSPPSASDDDEDLTPTTGADAF